MLSLDATEDTQAVELGVNAIREAVYLVTPKDDHDPEPANGVARFPGGEVWLITEKVTDEQTVLLGIINQKREDGTLDVLPVQNQLQSLFDLVVLIATIISSDIIPEGGKFAYLHKEFLEALSNKQGGQGVVMVMDRFGFHVPDDKNPEYRGRLTPKYRKEVCADTDNLSQALLEREEGYWQRVAANQQQRKQAA